MIYYKKDLKNISKYTIIYLYDFRNDKVSYKFVENYGGKLHNLSSLNVTIMTYFETFMVKRWTNVHFRDEIRLVGNEYEKMLSLTNNTMLGALVEYITFEEHKKFQPINSNWGITAEVIGDKKKLKDKKYKNEIRSQRSLDEINKVINEA